MSTDSIKADFLEARAKTCITIANATGWQQGVVDPNFVGVDSVFFYVYDHQTQWIWCCSIPNDAFFAVLKKSESCDHAQAIACCGRMIAECAAAKGTNPVKENDLAIALAAYISQTKTYQLSDRAAKANHFVVIRYCSTDTLRPFAMGGSPRHLIAANSIEDSMKQVIAMDSKNHPEWIACK